MATYKIINTKTNKVHWVEAEGWNDPELAGYDEEIFEIELECNHSDARVCQAQGH